MERWGGGCAHGKISRALQRAPALADWGTQVRQPLGAWGRAPQRMRVVKAPRTKVPSLLQAGKAAPDWE